MKKVLGLVAVTALLLAGCNTISGAGQDLTAVGKGVSHVAGEVRDEIFGKPGPKPTGFTSVGQACDPSPGTNSSASGLPPCTDNGARIVYRD